MQLLTLLNHNKKHPVKTECFFYQCKLILLGVISTFLSSFLFALLKQILFPVTSISNSHLYPTFGSILIAIFISPVVEEMIFRNWLIPFLKKKGIRYRFAILFSALIFACLHFDWWLFPYFVNGVIYGIVKIKSHNQYTSILVHSLYNTLILLPLLIK